MICQAEISRQDTSIEKNVCKKTEAESLCLISNTTSMRKNKYVKTNQIAA
jgi:hypothetical protein